jgi:2-polyprenyl-6-methoxyphenol hydroxylase-like FAD-dependent oxidoreductase
MVYAQTEVVKDLITLQLADGPPLLFEATVHSVDVTVPGRPTVHFEHEGRDQTLSCDYVVGCDGFHGVTREAIPASVRRTFERTYPYSWFGVLAEVPPSCDELIYAHSPRGFALHSMRSPAVSRLYLQVPNGTDPAGWPDERIWAELAARFAVDGDWRLAPGPITAKAVLPMRSFVTEPMRHGRVFLAGDAAHVHSPVGGQGMNTGIGDAMNLGWKLSATVRGWGRPGLLDTYELERHPVGEMVLRMTDGAYKLVMARTRVGLKLRQQVIRLVLRVPRARRRIAGLLSGIDIHYARPAGAHPWVGRRMPDLTGVDGERLYEALRAGRFVLVGPADQPPVAGWSDRVVAFTCAPQDELPHTLLVRPDGYVDWAADEATAAEVHAALRERCGPELTHRA